MSTTLYAQPYDPAAAGFYFEDAETFATKSAALRNDHGQPVEEFEIQFIDGETIDAAVAETIGLHQGDVAAFFEKIEAWDEHQKRSVIIAAGECGYQFGWQDDPDTLDVDIFEIDSMRALAEHFVDEGLFGAIPEALQFYIDHDAIARDLRVDYAETEIARTRLIYRCA
ncbi:MAG: antirestriction protein ArdA [Pseudomonadota bacterium]